MALAYLEDLVGNQAVRLAVHGGRGGAALAAATRRKTRPACPSTQYLR
jgi:hypothetical protein